MPLGHFAVISSFNVVNRAASSKDGPITPYEELHPVLDVIYASIGAPLADRWIFSPYSIMLRLEYSGSGPAAWNIEKQDGILTYSKKRLRVLVRGW